RRITCACRRRWAAGSQRTKSVRARPPRLNRDVSRRRGLWRRWAEGRNIREFTGDLFMTRALEQAFREASKLSEAEKDALAEAIRAEIASEEDWEEAFEKSQDVLEKLADEALGEHRARLTRPITSKKR